MYQDFDHLPDSAFVRLSQLVGNPNTGSLGILHLSRTTLWRMVRDERFPSPVHISSGITAWRVADVRKWQEKNNLRPPNSQQEALA